MSKVLQREMQRGHGSEERPIVKDLWRRDVRPEHIAVADVGNYEPRRETIDYRRYYDPAFLELELEHVFLKTWLFAAREEDIPNVNDRVPFDVGPYSFIITRSGPDEFKAFYNSCMHRGTKLCSKHENSATIRCPYHAWEWNSAGELKRIPSHWDFPNINKTNAGLRQVKLDRWGGCIFINADPDSAPLADSLTVIPEHFKEFKLEDRYTAAWYRKLVPANWKIAQEAFMESYHVYATHPAAVPYNGDSQTQYDIWNGPDGHVGRQSTPSAVPSMHAPPDASPLEAANVYAQIMKSWHYNDAELPVLDPGKNLRQQIAQWHREVQERVYGRKTTAPDAVMLDSLLYFMFPQFTAWLSESLPFTYSFTPYKRDPNFCYFEVRMVLPWPKGKKRPPPCPRIDVAPHETIAEKEPGFGFLAMVFDQDMANMPLIQEGVQAADPGRRHSVLSAYQEMIIQQHHDLIDRYIERGKAAARK